MRNLLRDGSNKKEKGGEEKDEEEKGEGKRQGTKWREGRDEEIMGDGSNEKEKGGEGKDEENRGKGRDMEQNGGREGMRK